jgi:hypothetical protein
MAHEPEKDPTMAIQQSSTPVDVLIPADRTGNQSGLPVSCTVDPVKLQWKSARAVKVGSVPPGRSHIRIDLAGGPKEASISPAWESRQTTQDKGTAGTLAGSPETRFKLNTRTVKQQ